MIEIKQVAPNHWVFNEVHEAEDEVCAIPFFRAMLVDRDERLNYIGEWWYFSVPDPETHPNARFEEWEWVTVLRISRTEPQFRTREPNDWEVCFLLYRQATVSGLPDVIPTLFREELTKFLAENAWQPPLEQAA